MNLQVTVAITNYSYTPQQCMISQFSTGMTNVYLSLWAMVRGYSVFGACCVADKDLTQPMLIRAACLIFMYYLNMKKIRESDLQSWLFRLAPYVQSQFYQVRLRHRE